MLAGDMDFAERRGSVRTEGVFRGIKDSQVATVADMTQALRLPTGKVRG